MKLNTLQDLLIEELQDIYDAENQILKALPKMAKAASAPQLQAASLLQQTLDEEGTTDKKLTQLAESLINLEAERA